MSAPGSDPNKASLATLGLSLEDGKKIFAEIQRQMVATQIEHRHQAGHCCVNCGRSRRNKGHSRSTFHSVYGKVPVRVRRAPDQWADAANDDSKLIKFSHRTRLAA